MKKRFTDDQIIGAVKKLEAGTPAKELSREMGVTQQSLYHWKRKFSVNRQPGTNFQIKKI